MNVRFTVLLVLLVVVIGGLVGVTQLLRSETGVNRGERLYRLDYQELVTIGIEFEGEEIVFSKDGGTWFISGDEDKADFPVDEIRWSGVPFLLGGPEVTQNLTEIGEKLGNLELYGLDPPRGQITLTPASGLATGIQIGDLTPTEDGYYAKVENTAALYIMHNTWVDVMVRLVTEPPYPVVGPAAPVDAIIEEPAIPR